MLAEELKIVSARITDMPRNFFDPLPQVWVTYEGGKEQMLFEYYPDEISFRTDEFIGLTRSEAVHLKFRKDKAYLQS
jgi:hypothetical protein